MLRIRDIMTPQVFTLDAEASAEEAAWALSRRHISGAPVRDADGNLIGILSMADLVNPEPKEWIKKDATVLDRMSPMIYAVYADDPALAAAELMQRRDVHRLLVLDENGKPAGIVTTKDVSDAVAGGQSFSLEGD